MPHRNEPEIASDNIRRFFRLIFRKAIITEDLYTVDRIVDDPSDNIFLACAMEAEADCIVSRDPRLRNIKRYRGIEIVDVKTFVEKVKRGWHYLLFYARPSRLRSSLSPALPKTVSKQLLQESGKASGGDGHGRGDEKNYAEG